MPLTVYRGSSADHPHENRAFDSLADSLARHWATEVESSALIGNFHWQGAQVDAAFISQSGIVLLDFKAYSGTIEFSENGPWRCSGVEVKGGGQENPLHQLRRSRTRIVKGSNSAAVRLSWATVKAAVVFDKATFDQAAIPGSYRPWFFVTDLDNAARLLSQLSSPDIAFAENAITDIVRDLDVRRYNGYSNQDAVEAIGSPISARWQETISRVRATASQERVLRDVARFAQDDARAIHLVSGIASTGKSQLIQWASDAIVSSGRAVRVLDAAPNTEGYIYSLLFDFDKQLRSDVKSSSRKKHRVIPIKENRDQPGTVYLVDNAHLISASPFEDDEDVTFGNGNLPSDLMVYTQAVLKSKVIFFGDRCQLLYGDRASMPIFTEYWLARNVAVSESDELAELIVSSERSTALEAAKVLRKNIIDGSFVVLSLAEFGIEMISEEKLPERTAKAILDAGDGAAAIQRRHEQVAGASRLIRQVLQQPSPEVAVGDSLEIYKSYETSRRHLPVRQHEMLRGGTIVRVSSVGESQKISQSLSGRDDAIVFHVRTLTVSAGAHEFSITILDEFLDAPKPRPSTDVPLALRVQTGVELPNWVYGVRYAYSITGHRAQRFPRDIGIIDANVFGRDLEEYHRWLYTAIVSCRRLFVLAGFKNIDRFVKFNGINLRDSIKIAKVEPEFFMDPPPPNVVELRSRMLQAISERLEGRVGDVAHRRSWGFHEEFQVSSFAKSATITLSYTGTMAKATLREVAGDDADQIRLALYPARGFQHALPPQHKSVYEAVIERLGAEFSICNGEPGQYFVRLWVLSEDAAARIQINFNAETLITRAQCAAPTLRFGELICDRLSRGCE